MWADLAAAVSPLVDPASTLADLALARADLAAAGSTTVDPAPVPVDLALAWADPILTDLAPARVDPSAAGSTTAPRGGDGTRGGSGADAMAGRVVAVERMRR